jgi:hypothetical protein
MPSAALRDRALRNRRLTIRHPAPKTTTTAIAVSPPLQKVRVYDVSEGGLALILPHAPAVGEAIYLQVSNDALGFTYDRAAEVRHTRPYQRGTWLVGLAFEQPLSAGELAGLI